MHLPTVLLVLPSLLGYSTCSNPDDYLPVYLRGINWNKVQEYLKEDLRLSNHVIPTNYFIDLSVNVRGHAGAEKSHFNGTVSIHLNITKPVNKIEIHSNGLEIEKAIIMESEILTIPVGVTHFSTDVERETFTVHANRTIHSHEKFMLQISYNGVATMDEYGLFESWDPKLSSSLDSNGPFILATRSFPTGARFWFPCFDEPDRKATFAIRVNHPSGLNAYSNTALERTEKIYDGRTISVFEKTRPLSTHQVALSVNHLSVQTLDVKGFGKVRMIISTNSHNYSHNSSNFASPWERKPSTDIPVFLKRNLEVLVGSGVGQIPMDKLDIIVIEGTYANSIQPGLITIGRYNFWKQSDRRTPAKDFRNLTQLLIGNQISVRNTNEMWLNDMLSFILMKETESDFDYNNKVPDQILHSSLHERPLRDAMMYHSTTTRQYLTSKNPLPSLKASNLLKLLIRYCPDAERKLKEYVAEHIGGFADVDDFIDNLSKPCEKPDIARTLLEDFINQPGKSFLYVKRQNGSVLIRQTRYHSTYFNSALRDNKTRYTIPIFYTIDGESYVKVFSKNETYIEINVPETSLFLIDHDFSHLYLVFYVDSIVPDRAVTEAERVSMVSALRESMLAAANIGFVKREKIREQEKHYIEKGIHSDKRHFDLEYNSKLSKYARRMWNRTSDDNSLFPDWGACDLDHALTWDGEFNNDTLYWEDLTHFRNGYEHYMDCLEQWNSSETYRKFLEENFLSDTSVIRPEHMAILGTRSYLISQWRELHRFFFRRAANISNHRFDLLAEVVLNQAQVERDRDSEEYPYDYIRDDYLNELRNFVIRHPRRAASMSTEIEMRLEREYLREERAKFHGRNQCPSTAKYACIN